MHTSGLVRLLRRASSTAEAEGNIGLVKLLCSKSSRAGCACTRLAGELALQEVQLLLHSDPLSCQKLLHLRHHLAAGAVRSLPLGRRRVVLQHPQALLQRRQLQGRAR